MTGAWIAGFRARALHEGIDAATLARAFEGLSADAAVIRSDRTQAEFTRTLREYLQAAVSEARIAEGRAALGRHAALFDAIEARHGVDRHVIAAIWGLESAYGATRGDLPVIRSLATLAQDGRRGAFFEAELLAALRILQRGDVPPARLTGSWAGAMGHTQFMPTSYLAHAVDFDGDGRADIWGDDPADALASAAAYLAAHGWTAGQPWAVEVTLPGGFDHGLAGKDQRRAAADWSAMGLRKAGGGPLPDQGAGAVLLPAGAQGPAFLIFGNFGVLARYNAADSYVIGVGHLADRLRGGPPIIGGWPSCDRALQAAERQELQERLTRAGFSTQGADGRIGPNTVAAIRAYQRAAGLVADGHPSVALLERLRG